MLIHPKILIPQTTQMCNYWEITNSFTLETEHSCVDFSQVTSKHQQSLHKIDAETQL